MISYLKKVYVKQKDIVQTHFDNKIKYKQTLYLRKNNREMGDDEIEKYKFKLFTAYALIPVLIAVLLLSII